jgi:hypothetical protein
MSRSGCGRCVALGVAGVVVVWMMFLWAVVAYGRHSIQRGARWTGITFEAGLALVYVCDPASGIRHAQFGLWPRGKVDFEKIHGG